MTEADARARPLLDEWRERAEAELAGAPLRVLTPRRADGLELDALELEDRSREEGLGSAPVERSIALVTDARAWPSARNVRDGVQIVWLRGSEVPEGIALPLVVEPELDTDRVRIGDHLVLADAATDRVLGSQRAWDARDAISAIAIHERGAGPVTQVALATSAMLERRRALGVARPPAFAAAVSPDIFVEIAKLRALRRLTDRVLSTIGEDVGVPLYVRTDVRSTSLLDRATNAIRATLGTAAAMMGGADCVGAVAMDALDGAPSPLGARLSRNTSLVLSRESQLGAVDDPARGSHFVEAATDRIARDAWELVQEIERRGGLIAAAEWVGERIDAESAARRTAVRTRSLPLVGVSRFAVAAETVEVSDTTRDASDFEHFHAEPRARAQLVVLGDRSAVEARASFARELLEAGALDLVEDGARAALIAAPDALFTSEVLDTTRSLTARGIAVWIAGRPGAHETELRDAGARGFVFIGADVVDVLAQMRAAAGVVA